MSAMESTYMSCVTARQTFGRHGMPIEGSRRVRRASNATSVCALDGAFSIASSPTQASCLNRRGVLRP